MNIIMPQAYLLDRGIIDKNVDWNIVKPIIEDVQELKVKDALGTNLYNLIVSEATPPGTLSAANETLLNDYVLRMMSHYIFADLPLYLKYRFLNKGVMSRSADNASPADDESIKRIEDRSINKAQEYRALMEKFIRANITDYPTYLTNTEIDQQQPGDTYSCDIYLPGDPFYTKANDAGELNG